MLVPCPGCARATMYELCRAELSRSIARVLKVSSKTSMKTFDETGKFPYEVVTTSNLGRDWGSRDLHGIFRPAHQAAHFSLGNDIAT